MTSSIFVHPQGLCESDAVGDGTRVWAFAHVLKGAVVGRDCNICDGAYVEGGAVVGDVAGHQQEVRDRVEGQQVVEDPVGALASGDWPAEVQVGQVGHEGHHSSPSHRGPTPVTRRLTHSTCWRGSSRKSYP